MSLRYILSRGMPKKACVLVRAAAAIIDPPVNRGAVGAPRISPFGLPTSAASSVALDATLEPAAAASTILVHLTNGDVIGLTAVALAASGLLVAAAAHWTYLGVGFENISADLAKHEQERKADLTMHEKERKADLAKHEETRKADFAKHDENRKADHNAIIGKLEDLAQERKADLAMHEENRKADFVKHDENRKADLKALFDKLADLAKLRF